MFTDKANTIADACRFCWMCRHVCPVGLVTGKESNNARAKGLLVSLHARGTEFDSSMADVMWECVLCGSCTNDCMTGYEPPVFIREARTKAIVENLAPEPVLELYDLITETGDIYGTGAEKRFNTIKDELAGLPEKADVLLYIGEVAAVKTPEIVKAVISLIKKSGTDFTVLKQEPSSGAYLGDLIGFVEEVRSASQKCADAINKSGASIVVVLDPLDARIMKHEYPEWNLSLNAEVKTATSFIAELVKGGKLKPDNSGKEVTLHDAGALSRDLDETEPAREIISAMKMELKEMFLHKDLSKSSGGALLPCYAPELSEKIAAARWADAKRTGAKLLLTEAPGSYTALSQAVPGDMELEDLFIILDKTCG